MFLCSVAVELQQCNFREDWRRGPWWAAFFPQKPDAQMIHSFPMNTWFEVGRFQFVFCDSNGSINSLVRDERKLFLVGSFIQAFSSSLTGPNFILT